MARIRSVHPDICTDEALAEMDDARAERTFVRLWTELDDEGRAKDHPKLLAAKLYPLHDSMGAAEVDDDLNRLVEAGLLVRYEVDGERVVAAKPEAWSRYQKPRHPSASTLPPPPATCRPVTAKRRNPPAPGAKPSASGRRPHAGEEGRGDGEGVELRPPQSAGNGRDPDPLWDAVMVACAVDTGHITNSARGGYNRAVSEIRTARGSPAQVPVAAKVFRHKYPGLTLTPSALAKHWPQLVNSTNGSRPKQSNCARCGRSLEPGYQEAPEGRVCIGGCL